MTGITVKLEAQVQTGVDELYDPVYESTWIDVDDCLVSPASTDDIATAESFYGKKASYIIAAPKGDDNDWTDKKVQALGLTMQVIGIPQEGIEANVPTRWHKKIYCEVIA